MSNLYKPKWNIIICGNFIILQIILIIYARFSTNRYFAWAPHDIQIEYYLEVHKNNVKLKDIQLENRYGLRTHGWVDLPPNHIFNLLEDYERCEIDSNTNRIVFKYRVNGKSWRKWIWNNSY